MAGVLMEESKTRKKKECRTAALTTTEHLDFFRLSSHGHVRVHLTLQVVEAEYAHSLALS